MLIALAVTCASFAVSAQTGSQLVAVPAFRSFVTDLSNALLPAERAQLEARLSEIEQQSGSQVAVLLLPSTQPEDIAAYAIRVTDAWKPGRKKVDDGVLLVVATQDRKLRIEVGRGLEGAIPDVTAKRIISETITPAFKQGKTYAGIAAGIEQIAASIKGEALPPPGQHANGNGGSFGALVPLLIFIAIIVMGFLRRGGRGGYYSSGRGSGLANFATGAVLGSLLGGSNRGGGGGWSGGGGGGFGGGGASGGW